MQELYELSGLSKQALLKYRQRQSYLDQVKTEVVDLCNAIRVDHKRMSCKRMYQKVKDEVSVGRDIFEQIGFAHGFRLNKKRNVHKTTWSQRIEVCPNLIEGLVLNRRNQLWQSDIFYISVEGEPYYGVTIMDVYSRYLLALHISSSLEAVECKKALLRAINKRNGLSLNGCIFHTDQGSQYISKMIKDLLAKVGMRRSMANLPQQNAYVERIQGTLKYEYLFEQKLVKNKLKIQCRKIMDLYNDERPHSELNMSTPSAFERLIENLPMEKRPKMEVYKWVTPLLTNNPVQIKREEKSKKNKPEAVILNS